ncbi:hypothetical protein LTR04_000305, partial [Oleoguttula sp. CCFEE 6159]
LGKLAIVFAALSGNGVDAFWRMNCGVIQTGRIDPIVTPGGISSHVHKIAGGYNIGLNSSYEDMTNSKCTSCEIGADKSAYWTPQLYYRHANGKFQDVPNSGMTVYYLGRGDNRDSIQPFPAGFRMLSGNALARSYDNTTMTYNNGRPVADRVSFNCLDSTTQYPETPNMIHTKCSNGLRAQIQFQSCWNGVDLYKTDNSHVAYMSTIDNGVCPPSHPVQLVHLFFEVLYGVAQIDTTDGGQFMFAYGDPTGFGFHGDFLNGWDPEVLAPALKQCANVDNAGQISACAPLAASDSSQYSYNCAERPSLINEPVVGMLDKLPGCINITPGPSDASVSDITCGPGTTSPSVNPFTLSTPSQAAVMPQVNARTNSWTYMGCANEPSGQRALAAFSYTNSGMTTAMCQTYCASKSQSLAGVEYGSECYCGNALSSGSSLGGANCTTLNSMVCAGNSTEFCGGPARLQVFSVTVPSTGPSVPAVGAVAGDFVYAGCANENSTTPNRALSGASYSNNTVTNDQCGAYCSALNFQYFGTEYGTECYCGNSLKGGSTLSQTGCSMACSGSLSSNSPFAQYNNTCGGSNRLSVWKNSKYQTTAVVPSVGSYVSQGCYYEASANGGSGRALTGASFSSSSMTVEGCVSFCAGKNMGLAAVEYSTECYCGTVLQTGSSPATDGLCNMACGGNKQEYCGGPNRLNVYKSS